MKQGNRKSSQENINNRTQRRGMHVACIIDLIRKHHDRELPYMKEVVDTRCVTDAKSHDGLDPSLMPNKSQAPAGRRGAKLVPPIPC